MDDLFFTIDTLQLKKSFRQHLINYIKVNLVARAKHFDEHLLQVFNVAQKYQLNALTEEIQSKNLGLEDFDLLENVYFTGLKKEYRCEGKHCN